MFTTDGARPFDLIAMGRVAVDLYSEQIGASLAHAQSFRKYLGGCAGNIAVGAARLGCKVSMLSCVGDDELGKFLTQTLLEEGVDTSALQISARHLTGLVLLGVCPPDHFPLMFFRNDCADMAIEKDRITKEYLAQAKALLITGTGLSHTKTCDVTLHAIKLAKEANTKIILDIDYRPVLWGLLPPGDGENRYVASMQATEKFSQILSLVDLVVGTEEECKLAGGSEDSDIALKNIRAQTNAPIVMKRGAEGALCFFNDSFSKPLSARGFSVPVVNVLGAGDAFMAGLLSCLLRAGDMRDALMHGNAAGAIAVARHGCSHSCPSSQELKYFLANSDLKNLVATKTLARLHQRVLLKDAARINPMPVFAFCHRWQLEDLCKQHRASFDKITLFKTALAEAYVDACTVHNIKNPWLLTDPKYGQGALRIAQGAEVGVIVALEKSGTRLIEWLEDRSAFEILHARPASWGVKVLVHLPNGMNDEDVVHQLIRLREVHDACCQRDRRLMLEVIVPEDAHDDDVVRAVERIYREDVTPFWWKLRRFADRDSFARLSQIIDEYDDGARVLILGGEAKNLADYSVDFAIAQSRPHGIGFAVGRSIFWQSFCAYIEERATLDDVKEQVATRMHSLYQMWRNTY